MEKVCEKLEKKDNQICDLRYDKEIDLKNTNLNKLKVKDLKKILNEWDEVCVACTEKSDFVKRVKELMPKHAPGSVKNDELWFQNKLICFRLDDRMIFTCASAQNYMRNWGGEYGMVLAREASS